MSVTIQAAMDLHRQGRLPEAERLYRGVLAQQPHQFDALHFLGVLKLQQGRPDEAFALISKAVEGRPDATDALSNLAAALLALKRFREVVGICDRILAVEPADVEAQFNRAAALLQLGRAEEALTGFDRVLALRPKHGNAHLQRANLLAMLARYGEALAAYDRLLSLDPGSLPAAHNRGNVLLKLGRPEEALTTFERIVSALPQNVDALNGRAIALKDLGRHEDALAASEVALAADAGHLGALVTQSNILIELKRTKDALALLDGAAALHPESPDVLANRAFALAALGSPLDALPLYERALAVRPGHAVTLNNRGNALFALGRSLEALASYDEALAVQPDNAEALANRAAALRALNRPAEALAVYRRLLQVRPDFPADHSGYANLAFDLGNYDEALKGYDRAIALAADNMEVRLNRARALSRLDRHDEAVAEWSRLRATKTEIPGLLSHMLAAQASACAWSDLAPIATEATIKAVDGTDSIDPFAFLGVNDNPADHLACARNWLRRECVTAVDRRWEPAELAGDRIRIAYLSADYGRHATANLISELFEIHDRSAFEVIGVSFGPDDASSERARLVHSFERFFDVSDRSDAEAVRLLRDLKVQIAVDLKGYTAHSRMGIFASRAAPIQVSYLGYPGTTGAGFMDYVIADPIVLPFDQQPFYSEKIVHLPDSYQVNDRTRAAAKDIPMRRQLGLPENGFVFCCFNHTWKLTAPVFDVWMRLLAAVDGSVLWLFKSNETAARNLRSEAQSRGVDPSRLVFAPPLEMNRHLARLQLADLFLDTLPYNAHTTMSDALWCGVPVVTCRGHAFAGRVGASLLNAVGLPELVATNLDEYRALATKLATDPEALRNIRTRLAAQRDRCALFDTDRFRRHIEHAYSIMWDTFRRGESPRAFSVPLLDAAPVQNADAARLSGERNG